MNIKEFNERQQSAIDFLEDLKEHGDEKLIIDVVKKSKTLINHIKELQPPTPPTCSTCNNCYHGKSNSSDDLIADYYNCLHDDISHNMLPYIEEPANFGCIHHSDYGVKDANN